MQTFLFRLAPVGLFPLFFAPATHGNVVTDADEFRDGLLPSYYEEDFSDFTEGYPEPQSGQLTFSGAEFSFDAVTVQNDDEITPADSLYFIEGDGYSGTALSLVENTDWLRLTAFNAETRSVGGTFFLTDDPGDLIEGTFTVTVTFSDDTTLTETLQSPAIGGELPFVGFHADEGTTITQVDISSEVLDAFVSAGDVIVGQPIPEPATVVLWSGLAVFATAVWIRRQGRRMNYEG